MTDFNAQELSPNIFSTPGEADDIGAAFTDTSNTIVVGGSTVRLKMRGIDNANSNYVTWNVISTPDPNGAQANASNTTPTLVGSIVAGTGVIVSIW